MADLFDDANDDTPALAPPAEAADPVDHRTVVGRHRRASTRARIVEAAASVYARKGPDAAVIDDFVKAAGTSRGTFFNHFPKTSELLEATVEWFEQRLAHSILEVILRYPDLASKSAMAMRLHLHWITSDPALCDFFSRVPQVAEAGRQEARAQLRRGIADGVFRIAHLDAACDLIFGTMAETIRRVAKAPGEPTHCNDVVRSVLVCLGLEPGHIDALMALPLPDMPAPVRLIDAADAVNGSTTG